MEDGFCSDVSLHESIDMCVRVRRRTYTKAEEYLDLMEPVKVFSDTVWPELSASMTVTACLATPITIAEMNVKTMATIRRIYPGNRIELDGDGPML